MPLQKKKDNDWLNRFFEEAKLVSHEEMQSLTYNWAAICLKTD